MQRDDNDDDADERAIDLVLNLSIIRCTYARRLPFILQAFYACFHSFSLFLEHFELNWQITGTNNESHCHQHPSIFVNHITVKIICTLIEFSLQR